MKFSIIFSVFLIVFQLNYAQEGTQDKPEGYDFDLVYETGATPVKSQGRTGTCWSFSTHSFLESELMRLGQGEHDLSEMFVVRNIYIEKAENYVRRQGKANFSQGSLAHDVIRTVEKYGLMPEEVYSGMDEGDEQHNHSEMETVLKGFLDAVIKNAAGNLELNKDGEPKWREAYIAILDTYMGIPPETFTYEGKEYTARSFADEILKKTDADEYVTITSFSHHPFYESFILEIPDNFSNGSYYNVPVDEMEKIAVNALKNGFSIAWDVDVSEEGFSARNGIAILPFTSWSDLTETEKKSYFESPGKEMEVTQEDRQRTFNTYSTTDDHLMHITGLAQDQNGTNYFVTKNSWGEVGPYDGYLYSSSPYFRLKTISIIIHKDALPKEMKKKLELK